MKYLCLIYRDENSLDSVPQDVLNEAIHGCEEFCANLRSHGTLLAAERLKPTSTATTLRFDGDRASITDGPFAETKEQLGGFLLIEARDLDEAIAVASKFPAARFGCVEVRPIMA